MNLILSIWEYLHTPSTLRTQKQKIKVPVQRPTKFSPRVRIKSLYHLIHKLLILQAESREIRRCRIDSITVHPPDIPSRKNWKSRRHIDHALRALGPVRPEEPIRHTTILEEATRDVEVELPIGPAAVDEEVDREDGLGISADIAQSDE